MSKSSKSQTHRADGTPTAYGFACGYGLEREQDNFTASIEEQKRVTLYQVNGVFEIKSIDWSKHSDPEVKRWADAHGWNDPYDFRKWRTATTVHEGRRLFRQECKRLGLRVTP